MSFGAAFDAFVGGMSKGLSQGQGMADRREKQRPARENRELTQEASKLAFGQREAGNSFLDRMKARMQSNVAQPSPEAGEVIPTSAEPDETRFYAAGGFVENVDPIEQDNGSYYRQEAIPNTPRDLQVQREVAPDRSGALPTTTAADGTPTPPPRPAAGASNDALSVDSKGNIIQKTVQAVSDMPTGGGAVPTGEAPPNGIHHPIQTMVDPSGRSYPDLTTTVGGIRQVTGAPAGRPLQTADHINFLETRYKLALQKGYDPNEALKFNVQYLDNLRLQAGRSFALAEAAWDAGDGAAVQKFVQQGYGFIPDGKGVRTEFRDGKLIATPYDERTGKPAGEARTMTKDDFLRTGRSITGDLISYGRAVSDDPLPRGYGRGSRGSRGRGRRAEGGATDDAVRMTATDRTQIERFMRPDAKTGAAPMDVDVATGIFRTLPKDARDPSKAAVLAKGLKDKTLWRGTGPNGYGVYTRTAEGGPGELKQALAGGTTPNKMAPAAAPKTETTPVSAPVKPAEQGNPEFKRAPGAQGTTQAPGTVAAATPKPETGTPVIPTEEGPGMLERLRGAGRSMGDVLKRGGSNMIEAIPQGKPTAPPVEAAEARAERLQAARDWLKNNPGAEDTKIGRGMLQIIQGR